MKTASIGGLCCDFKKAEALRMAGESVQITRLNQFFDTIAPSAAEPKVRKPLPDYAAQMK